MSNVCALLQTPPAEQSDNFSLSRTDKVSRAVCSWTYATLLWFFLGEQNRWLTRLIRLWHQILAISRLFLLIQHWVCSPIELLCQFLGLNIVTNNFPGFLNFFDAITKTRVTEYHPVLTGEDEGRAHGGDTSADPVYFISGQMNSSYALLNYISNAFLFMTWKFLLA